MGAALAALEKERAVVVVAVNNKEEVALFVAAVDPSQLIFLLVFCPPWNMGSLFQSDVRG